jgi:hypothetical protein
LNVPFAERLLESSVKWKTMTELIRPRSIGKLTINQFVSQNHQTESSVHRENRSNFALGHPLERRVSDYAPEQLTEGSTSQVWTGVVSA